MENDIVVAGGRPKTVPKALYFKYDIRDVPPRLAGVCHGMATPPLPGIFWPTRKYASHQPAGSSAGSGSFTVACMTGVECLIKTPVACIDS